MRLFFGILLLLTGCVASAPQSVAPDPLVLRQQLTALPGVQLEAEQPLTFSYPGEALFASGAVLPLPGGTAVLDPLCQFLQRYPELTWRVELHVTTAYGEDYDQNLVEKRSELLATYLLSKGVALAALEFLPQVRSGPALTFTLIEPPAAATDHGGKQQ